MSARIAGIAVVLALVFAGTAYAAEGGASGSQVSTTPAAANTSGTEPVTNATEPSSTTTNSTEPEAKDSGDDNADKVLAGGVILLGAFGILMAYVFYDRWRGSYEKLAMATLQISKVFPVTIFNPVEDAQFRGRGLNAAAASQQPVVSGPATVTAGEPTTYKAELKEGSADSCTWLVEPPEAATVEPATGATVTVTATKEGPFKLSVKGTEGEPTLVPISAVGKTSGGGVPLLGTGFAGVVAVIVAVAIAGGLTALGTLGADAFIAFLGPVLGYFFARAQSAEEGEKAGAP